MTTTSIPITVLRPRSLARGCLTLLLLATLFACGSGSTAYDESLDAGALAEVDASLDEDAVDPPAIDPGGASDRAVETFEAGAGDITVVFESGLGDDWSPWRTVATDLSARTRVFAYSRPGYGGSDPSDGVRDGRHIVEELRGLLARRGAVPPYVLVGHSFGGAYMELFAKIHPEEVAGLVLVDPRHRDFASACERAGLDGCVIPEAIVPTLPPVQAAEYEAFAGTSRQIADAGPFGQYPVRVLIATEHGFASEVEALWVSMLGSLADEAPHGDQHIFVGAGHYLQLQRASEVSAVILRLVSASGS